MVPPTNRDPCGRPKVEHVAAERDENVSKKVSSHPNVDRSAAINAPCD